MNDEFYDFPPEQDGDPGDWPPGGAAHTWFDSLRQLWQWDELAAEVGQESQARIALAGRPGVGKSVLFNRLRGWIISDEGEELTAVDSYDLADGIRLESLGLFVLADLPEDSPSHLLHSPDLLLTLGDPALVLYLVDGKAGVTAADYRWVAALRATGKPLLAVLNKVDLLENLSEAVFAAEDRLGMPVIPISAQSGTNVAEKLLPAILAAAPRLAVPLGRELRGLRRTAARRVIRQAALFSGIVGAQPVPLLDVPFQVMIQVGVVMRVGAVYGFVPTGGMNRELIGTVISALGLRYLILALVKLIPFVGWAAAGMLSGMTTFLMGEAAVRYYEGGASLPLARFIVRPRDRLGGGAGRLKGWLRGKKPRLPRLRRRRRRVTAAPREEIINLTEKTAENTENAEPKEQSEPAAPITMNENGALAASQPASKAAGAPFSQETSRAHAHHQE